MSALFLGNNTQTGLELIFFQSTMRNLALGSQSERDEVLKTKILTSQSQVLTSLTSAGNQWEFA